jgi:hypothetical protein
MEKVNRFIIMVRGISEIFLEMQNKEKEFTILIMEIVMKGNGKMINVTEKVNNSSLMDLFILEIGLRIKDMVVEF